MKNYYAVITDDNDTPSAMFEILEQAIEWGLEKFGGDKFSIRGFLPGEATAAAQNVEPGRQEVQDPSESVETLN